jgi:hypothetical protein
MRFKSAAQRKAVMAKLYYAKWNSPMYGKFAKYVNNDFFSVQRGFSVDDISEIRKLKTGQKWVEATPLGPGFEVKRLK